MEEVGAEGESTTTPEEDEGSELRSKSMEEEGSGSENGEEDASLKRRQDDSADRAMGEEIGESSAQETPQEQARKLRESLALEKEKSEGRIKWPIFYSVLSAAEDRRVLLEEEENRQMWHPVTRGYTMAKDPEALKKLKDFRRVDML